MKTPDQIKFLKGKINLNKDFIRVTAKKLEISEKRKAINKKLLKKAKTNYEKSIYKTRITTLAERSKLYKEFISDAKKDIKKIQKQLKK